MEPDTPRRGERTRSALVRAAHEQFIQNGYHGASMRTIARQAGLALGGIYNHFPGKEELFVAVLTAYHPFHQILAALESAGGSTLEAFIRAAAQAMQTGLQENPGFLNLMFIEIVEFNQRHMQALFDEFYPSFLALSTRFAGKDAPLRPLSLAVIVRAFAGLFFSYYITGLLLAGRQVPGQEAGSLDEFVDIFLHGILSDPVEKDHHD